MRIPPNTSLDTLGDWGVPTGLGSLLRRGWDDMTSRSMLISLSCITYAWDPAAPLKKMSSLLLMSINNLAVYEPVLRVRFVNSEPYIGVIGWVRRC